MIKKFFEFSEAKLYYELSKDEYRDRLIKDLDEGKILEIRPNEIKRIGDFFNSNQIRFEVSNFSGYKNSAITSKFSLKNGNWIYEIGVFIRRRYDDWFDFGIGVTTTWTYPHDSSTTKPIRRKMKKHRKYEYCCDQVDGVVELLEDKINKYLSK